MTEHETNVGTINAGWYFFYLLVAASLLLFGRVLRGGEGDLVEDELGEEGGGAGGVDRENILEFKNKNYYILLDQLNCIKIKVRNRGAKGHLDLCISGDKIWFIIN